MQIRIENCPASSAKANPIDVQPAKRVRRKSAKIFDLFPEQFELGPSDPEVIRDLPILMSMRKFQSWSFDQLVSWAIERIHADRRTEMLKNRLAARKAMSASGRPAIRLATVGGTPVELVCAGAAPMANTEHQGLGEEYHRAMAGHLAFIRDIHVREMRRVFEEHARSTNASNREVSP